MRDIAGQGEALFLMDGYGYLYNYCCIKRIQEKHSIFAPNGNLRKIEFDLELTFYGDNLPN